jgi:peptide/nickel transport system substrate-binding protein
MKHTKRLLAVTACLSVATIQAYAVDLVIGSSTEASSIDPLFSRTGNNQNIAQQIFDRLLETDANLKARPGLAETWQNVDPLTWRVRLRPNVSFHDGGKLGAEDVIFSLERAGNVPASPAPFSGNVAAIASMKAIDGLTIEFKTKAPTPDFMDQIGFVYILRKAVAEGAPITAYNSGKAAIGTGPYKFRQWTPGDNLTLSRNDAYWGKKPDFENVTIKVITNDAARIAALRSGAVDLIDAVPPSQVKALSEVKGLTVHSTASARLIYLALDSVRNQSPFITGKDGKSLANNPLGDVRVRRALSELIPRKAIVDRLLGGAGEPAGQIVPAGIDGHNPDISPPSNDAALAKKLLADAGYPEGFGLTIHTSNDRFPGDGELGQAIGQMFARGGLTVNGVVAQPYNVYATAAGKMTFSAFIFSFGTSTPSSATGLRNLLMSADRDAGTGSFNRTRYSNPAFDKLMAEALAEFDAKSRIALLQKATKLAFDDYGIIPLYWQKVHWASKSSIAYEANKMEDLTASLASLVK